MMTTTMFTSHNESNTMLDRYTSSQTFSQKEHFPIATSDALVSDQVLHVFIWIVWAILTLLIDVFGTITNILNIVCFLKQGFKDTVNISLLGLAISDLGCVLCLVWTNICFNPSFNQLELPFEPQEFQYLTGSWPHVTFTRITSWITAFITLERCICIILPLKVKMIFTHKRVLGIIVFIYVFLISNMIPIYYVNRMAWKFSAVRNRTLIGLVFTEEREDVEQVTFAINNVFLQFSSFVIVVVCTVIIVIKLRDKSNWRTMSTATGSSETSTRDKKVTKMLIVVSMFFIASFVPLVAIAIATIFQPDISIDGKQRNLLILLGGIVFCLESVNSSANIFIYYYMSTSYRAAFRHLFVRKSYQKNTVT